jgi:pyruvate dehydrogenase E2 component (dihydrolipoamide acetyltransferase)
MNAAVRLVEVRVPDMGNFKDVAVIDVLVKPGETIEPEAPLVTLETEKATMDVPSTASGVIEKVHVAKGGTVSTGDLIATVRASAEPAAAGAATGASRGETPASRADAPGPRSDGTAPQAAYAAAGAPASAGAPGSAPAGTKATPPASPQATPAAMNPAAGNPAGVNAAAAGSAGAAGRPSASATANTSAGANGSSRSGSTSAAPSANASPAASLMARLDLPPINEPGFSRAHAGPSVRKFARELGVDLTRVKGSGFKGRITHEDVKAFVKSSLATPSPSSAPATARAPAGGGGGLPVIPAVDFSQFGPVETKPLSRIQKISGPRLHASWVNIPHVTQFDEADITDLEATRNRLKDKAAQAGIKLTPLAFIIRACVRALQEFPQFNASLDPNGANIVLKKYFHIGFAADTPNGLVVPVVHDADRKDIYKTARELSELSEKARAGKLSPTDMQGGCFTISSLGGIGGTAFTPIINAPEVAILGVSRSTMKPVYRDGTFVPRLMLPLSLSYDHRVIDGASAARFTTFLAQSLANVAGLIEAVP